MCLAATGIQPATTEPCDTGSECAEPQCPNACSLRGMCVNGTCVCNPGFNGACLVLLLLLLLLLVVLVLLFLPASSSPMSNTFPSLGMHVYLSKGLSHCYHGLVALALTSNQAHSASEETLAEMRVGSCTACWTRVASAC